MAIKSYNSKADYNAAVKPTTESQVSMIEATREIIVDGVNVGEDVFMIETEITKNGAHIMKQYIETRNRLSRAKRWQQMDEDIDYAAPQLDKDIVNPSQIRTVIRGAANREGRKVSVEIAG